MTSCRDGFIAFRKEFVIVSIPQAYRTPGCPSCGLDHSIRQDSSRAETSTPFIEFVRTDLSYAARADHLIVIQRQTNSNGSVIVRLLDFG